MPTSETWTVCGVPEVAWMFALASYVDVIKNPVRDADLMICVYDPAKTTGGTASTIKKIQAAGSTHILVDIAGRKTRLIKAK